MRGRIRPWDSKNYNFKNFEPRFGNKLCGYKTLSMAADGRPKELSGSRPGQFGNIRNYLETFKKVITGDEPWVYIYDCEIKVQVQSSQGRTPEEQ